jgi:DNA-directed RNA polymerase specialized sigma24 family protein
MARNIASADLARNFRTADAAESVALLDSLMVDVATPLVRQTVKRRFGSARNTTREDFEDVCADSLFAIVVRLRRYRDGAPEIAEFENYAAAIASNTADRFFAARAPQRARLRNRIRYVLTTDARFLIQESEGGIWLCGFRRAQPFSVPLSDPEIEVCRGKLARAKLSTARLPELIREILSIASGPLELTDLTTFAAHAMGVTDRMESIDDHAELLRDPAVSFAHSAELKDWLRRLWAEVCRLPPLQRIALLLNLGSAGSNGGANMCAIADLGIATFRALAASLEMAEAELAAIWNRVPLEDTEIAARLHLERQQVINLRSSARQRLSRRMTAIENTGPRSNTGAQPDTRGLS